MISPVATEQPFPMGERQFVAMMASFQALQALAIDAMLPALGEMSHDLHVTDANHRQLVVGVFLICSGLGSLFPGSLADRFGRRRVILGCLGGYIFFNLAAALAPEFNTLLILRGLCGLTTAGLIVVSSAIIRDRFSGDKMARTQSLVSMTFMIVPMIAPTIGQAVLAVAGWRSIFLVMALLGASVITWAWFRLPETLHPEFRQPVNLGAITGNMRIALTNRAAMGYVLGVALVQGALFGYINSSQQLVAEHFGLGSAFPLYFGAMALCMSAANLGNSRVVMRFGARRVSHAALLAYIVLAGMQLWFASRGNETVWEFTPLMTLNMCLMAFIGSNFGSIALQPFARIAGAAASVQTFLRMLLGSMIGALIGQAFDGTARPLAAAMLMAGTLALLLVLFSERGKLFRRLHGQVQQA
jgi:DHA1 family bicyclomycin/chloramphenicol resistance-like MFS transporter